MVRAVHLTVVAAASLVLLAGCSGKVAGIDLTQPNPDPTYPGPDPNPEPDPVDPPVCAAIAAACAPGDRTFSSETACKAAGSDSCYTRSTTCNGAITATIICGHAGSTCGAVPSCDGGDSETTVCPKTSNARCYTRTVCGTTITCVHYDAQCDGIPVCDPGDTQLPLGSSTCSSPAVSCYSRTVCGTTILCAKVK